MCSEVTGHCRLGDLMTFRRGVVPAESSSESVDSEMSVAIYQSIQRDISEDFNLHEGTR